MMQAMRRDKLRKKIEIKNMAESMKRQKMDQMEQQQMENEEYLMQDMTLCETIEYKVFKFYEKLLVYPDNKRLRYFHLVVSLTLFFDFYLTGLIMGNYLFITS